jgi:hypothetical protein
MFDGQLQSWNTPSGYKKEDGYAILFGATETGQVIIFDRDGGIDQRFQLHEGSIIQMSCSSKNQCLVTLGTGISSNAFLASTYTFRFHPQNKPSHASHPTVTLDSHRH